MSAGPIRVLVVDDSAFARKVLREVLTRPGQLEVVGIAHDGLDALEKISELEPDVITLDLMMPHLDGLGVLAALRTLPSPPRAVVVSTKQTDSELVVAALAEGAIDFVHKPTALATDRLYEMAEEIRRKVIAAASAARGPQTPPPQRIASPERLPSLPGSSPLVVIGTSTGGPQALSHLLRALPADFPAPVAITLHIPPGYTEALAARLNELCALEVVEASEGLALRPGRVVLARAGIHLKIRGRGEAAVAHLDLSPVETPHRPAVDVLFRSAAEAWGPDVLGVVLTGMGNDGLEGARAIRAAGGRVVTEAESSCVIYGMPRTVKEAGLANRETPLEHLAPTLVELVSR